MSAAPLPAIAELAELDQWVAWKYLPRRGKVDKPPVNPHTGEIASHSNPSDWGSYAQAVSGGRAHAGVGFVFHASDPYTGVDLDGCRDKQSGQIDAWAQRWIDALHSYTEISPSREGVKVFVRGTLPATLIYSMGAHIGIEVYSEKRYFTVTGQHLAGTPTAIHGAQTALEEMWVTYHKEIAASAPRAPKQSPGERAATRPISAPTIPDVLAVLRADGAIQTSAKDLTCPYCNHTHKNTLFIFKGRVYSRSPGCVIPQTGGLDTVGLHALIDYGSNTEANRTTVLKTRYPLANRAPAPGLPADHRSEAERWAAQQSADSFTDYVLAPAELERRAAEAQRKRHARQEQAQARKREAAEIHADVRARATADATLRPYEHAILESLLTIAGDRNWCRPSKEQIANVSGVPLGTVKRAMFSAAKGGRLEGRYFLSEGKGGGKKLTAIRTFLCGSIRRKLIHESIRTCDLYSDSGASERGADPPQPDRALLACVRELASRAAEPGWAICDYAELDDADLEAEADRLLAVVASGLADGACGEIPQVPSPTPAWGSQIETLDADGEIVTGPAGAVAVLGGAAYVPPAAEQWYQAVQPAQISELELIEHQNPHIAEFAHQVTDTPAPAAPARQRPRREISALDRYRVDLAGMEETELAGEIKKHQRTLKKYAGAHWLSQVRAKLDLVQAEIDDRELASAAGAEFPQLRPRRRPQAALSVSGTQIPQRRQRRAAALSPETPQWPAGAQLLLELGPTGYERALVESSPPLTSS